MLESSLSWVAGVVRDVGDDLDLATLAAEWTAMWVGGGDGG